MVEVPPEAEVMAPAQTTLLIKRVRPAMGTFVEVSLYGLTKAQANEASAAVFSEFARIEDSMSAWKPTSQLSNVNAAAGKAAVVVDQELFDLVKRALSFAEETEGAFDPTFAAMWGLWTFGDDGVDQLPNPKEVEKRRSLIDYRKVKLDPKARTIFLEREGMKLGLGGIAKGYATDRAAAILRERGARDFLIKAGGELFASGTKGGKKWRVGIRDPRSPDHFAALALEDRAFDTSGDYERFFEANGERYHHIIDPKTGYPATRSRSATVLAKEATTSDALSTALFVLGPKRAMPLVEKMPGVEAVLVGADNELHVSSGLKDRLQILRPPTKGP